MKFYLAARFDRREEMNEMAEVLEQYGHSVTSRWHSDMQHQDTGEPLDWTIDALEDLQDVRRADGLVLFTELPGSGSTRGGRHAEFGVALERRVPVFVCGPRENVFHTLANKIPYDKWEAFCATLNDKWPDYNQTMWTDVKVGEALRHYGHLRQSAVPIIPDPPPLPDPLDPANRKLFTWFELPILQEWERMKRKIEGELGE